MRKKVPGNNRSLTKEELTPILWEAVNTWTDLEQDGINIARALRYDMLQFAWMQLQEVTDATPDN